MPLEPPRGRGLCFPAEESTRSLSLTSKNVTDLNFFSLLQVNAARKLRILPNSC